MKLGPNGQGVLMMSDIKIGPNVIEKRPRNLNPYTGSNPNKTRPITLKNFPIL